jgi:signal transduction histidine kinase
MPETLDSHESHTHRSWTLSEWPVVRKVALVLAIPLLLAVALGGLRVQGELATASAANAAASQVTVLRPAVAYLSAAEDAAMVFRSTEDQAQREAALKAVNDAASELEAAWSGADLSAAQRVQVRQLLDSTQALRDGSAYAIVSTATDQLTNLEADVTLGIAAMTEAGSGTESLIGLVGQLNEGRLAVTQQQLLINPRPDIIPKNELYGHLGVESAAIGSLEQLLPDDPDVNLLRQYNESNNGLLGIGTPDLKGQQPLRLYDNLTEDLLSQIESALAAQATGANRTALLTAVLTGLALLLAIGLGLAVSRLLVRPIQRVRDGALAVAHEELPETVRRIRAGQEPGEITTIPVTSHEEMGQLARAVDDLHETAVRLAQDEAELRSRVADMFVTLSRRNTSLVNQQLRLIERLESDEEDPQRLESLFRLDHLASRMRRTAESLVVLADAPTQSSEKDVLSVDEALQAATAGVQDYQRVQVSGAPALRISGLAAPDVVHLFTELVDNALNFSPPSTTVTVTASTPAGLVLVEVADAGLGIDHETLAELNHTLRTGAEVSAETARRMGLFVVARLARRHGLTVTLERNAEGGTTAKVFIPRPLLSSGTAADAEPSPAVALAAVPPAPEARPAEPDPLDETADAAETDEVEVDEVEQTAPVPAAPVAGDSLFRRPDQPAAPVAPSARETTVDARPPAATNGTSLDMLSAVINANIRLPQRQPGTADQPTPLTPVLPRRGAPVQPEPDPVAELVDEPVGEPVDQPVDEVEGPEAVTVLEEAPQADTLATVTQLPEPVEVEPVVAGPVTPEPASASVSPASALDSPAAYALDGHADDDETPMFRMLRSSWFSHDGGTADWGPGEADAGWQAADRVAETAPSRLSRSGLPVRDPGNRLVPGGMAQPAPSLHRDPEAIRARLAAHAAGVARGRTMAMAQPGAQPAQPDQPTDTAEDVTP